MSLGSILLVLLGWAGSTPALDQHGEERAWKGGSGHYTLVDFAASWCAPCRTTLPRVEELAHRFPELEVLVVSVDDRVEGRDSLVESLGLELPVLWDADYAIAEHYQPSGMPATFLVDPEGHVVYRHTGSALKDWRQLVELVESLFPNADTVE